MIVHHLDEATMLAYAAGTLDEAFAVVVAAHAAWCPDCRDAIRNAEALGGEFLTTMETDTVSNGCRQRTMASLEGAALYRLPQKRTRRTELPGPLARILGGDPSEIRWHRVAPGIAKAEAKLSPGAKGRLQLLRIAPGKVVPEHGHGGEEITLVLKGSYRDCFGRFGRGNVADLDEEVEHKPVVEGDEECICVVATVAPNRFKSVFVRLMQPIASI